MAFKGCFVENCLNKHFAKDMCRTHYLRNYRYGDVNFTKTNWGIGETREDRFWSKVSLTCNENDCWEWKGCTDSNGYGLTSYKYKRLQAHILAWYFTKNKYPNLFLLHSCDNPPCCNPNHLREGTQKENVTDAVIKGRHIHGELVWKSKLTEDEVIYIKQQINLGRKQADLVRKFNVSRSCISAICTERNWKHIKI